ncbi:tectonin beta-propeller repeat-containing protein 1-like, partial [Amphiura filiformis]|uniref:tectonin beta-propeller repeat-containing protein 1-like n=1 Tax=Amphiura filiformis TaxID=82378 RepID=UPI003B21CCDC
TVSTLNQHWDLRSHGTNGRLLDFKQVTATRYSVWAIGCDQKLYTYVHSGDVPIRCLEYTYENQRWNPVHGFSHKSLLFADRTPWSDEKGFHLFPKPHEIKLPSEHWVWESDWHVEENIKGQPTGKGGWQYSVNFNTRESYTPDKKWNSCVRRRKWIRYRKYNATDVWAKVPGLTEDPMMEPFMDLSIGGYELPGQPDGYLSVWAITAPGKVYCRVGVTRKCPEGLAWKNMETPDGKAVVQLSVGPTGMVWTVTWDGCVAVRAGVSRDNPVGTGWVDVEAFPGTGLSNVVVGTNAVWAITRNHKVLFRKGFEAIRAYIDAKACTGESWIEMIGKMAAISIGPSDQVWAIGYDDRKLYLRIGVSYMELSGRGWKLIDLPSKKHIDEDVESLSESLSSIETSSSIQQKSTYVTDVAATSRSIRSVTMPGMMPPTLRKHSDDSMVDDYVHESNGRTMRTIAIQTDPPQRPQSEMPAGMAQLLSDRLGELKGFPTNGINTPDIVLDGKNATVLEPNVPEGNGLDGTEKTLQNIDTEGLTLEEVEANVKAPSRSREGSWSSNYSDTIVNFVFDGDDSLEPVQFLDAECCKGTQTDWKDAELLRCQKEELERIAQEIVDKKRNEDGQDASNNQCNNSKQENLNDNNMQNNTTQDVIETRSLCSVNSRMNSEDNLSRTSDDRIRVSSDHVSLQSEDDEGGIDDDVSFYQHMTLCDSTPVSYTKHIHGNNTIPTTGNLNKFRISGLSDSGVITLSDRRLNRLIESRVHRSASEPMIGPEERLSAEMNTSSLEKLTDEEGLSSRQDSGMELKSLVNDPEELMWLSISGGGCKVNPSTLPKWFHQSTVNNNVSALRLQEGNWRGMILDLLKERRERETKKFGHYPLAVERMSWVKVGRIQWFCEGKRRQWVDSTVELEKGLDSKGMHQSKFTLHYRMSGKLKAVRVLLSEVTCVMVIDSQDKPTMGIYTAKRVLERKPIKLRYKQDNELCDWIAALSLACCEVRGIWGGPSPRAAWCVTSQGDVFVHDASAHMETSPSSQMYWRQIGGHMAVVATCPGGIVWGLGMDHTPWVYTGGYGGGLFKGIYSSTTGIYPQTDSRNIYIYENQRWNPIGGFSDRRFPIDHYTWTDENGKQEQGKESVNPPSTHWQWVTDWRIDFTVHGSTDKDGWQYAKDHKNNQAFHKDKRWNDYVRRRRWVRKCQLLTTGPWREVPNLPLIDLSLQVDIDQKWDGPIALWAVGANGDVVTRMGVTRDSPQGTSWIHVPTDQPFISLSVGGNYRVWAIAKDGSAFYRNGVSSCNPTGDTWFHIAPPPIAPLKQISAGKNSVWVIDALLNLWMRENITSTFPEGTKWIHVSPKVRRVSVGPQSQVWILAEHVDGAKGVICRREGITSKNPSGTAWDKGAGGGIIHLSVRSCTKDENAQIPKMEDGAMATIQGSTFYVNRHEDNTTNSQGNALC